MQWWRGASAGVLLRPRVMTGRVPAIRRSAYLIRPISRSFSTTFPINPV